MTTNISSVEYSTGWAVLLYRWAMANELEHHRRWDELSDLLYGGWVFADDEELEEELELLYRIAGHRSHACE